MVTSDKVAVRMDEGEWALAPGSLQSTPSALNMKATTCVSAPVDFLTFGPRLP